MTGENLDYDYLNTGIADIAGDDAVARYALASALVSETTRS